MTEAYPTNLTGNWELREMQAGMMPSKTYPAGNGNRLQFGNTTFERYEEGQLVDSGQYKIEADSTVQEAVGLELPKGQFTHRLHFAKDSTNKTFFDLQQDTLVLLSGFFPVDAGSRRIYVKTYNSQ